MTRETSIEAYYKVKESGCLSALRLEVYRILCYHAPMTANEMRQYGNPNANSGVYSTRLSELEQMGAVMTIGTRPCTTTGHNALVWDITGRMPDKLKKKPKSPGTLRQEYLNELVKHLTHFHQRVDMFYKDEVQELLNLAKLAANTKG